MASRRGSPRKGSPKKPRASEPRAEASGDPAPAQPKRQGRRYRAIVGVLIGAVIVYLLGVGLASVVPELFWPRAAALSPDVQCEPALRELRTSLLEYAADRTRAAAGTEESMEPFFDGWDDRFMGLESRCEDEHDAWDLLGRLRQRTQGSLERQAREEGELARALDDALGGPAPANGAH
ncbi:MAG: hypothetical protein AB7S26_15140 [Sandaracinaceae bacterium]